MPSLNVPQAQFLTLPHKFRAFVAGYGSGKTWVGSAGLCRHAWEFPRVNSGYFGATYPQIRDIFYPTIDEVAHDWGLRTKVNQANKEVHLFAGRVSRGTIICRSMEDPSTIVGFKIGRALADEVDVLKTDKAKAAWRKIIARMRYKVDGLQNGVDLTTTPEGFKFTYEQFVTAVRDNPELGFTYGLIQASTYDNEANLPDDYISSLRSSYPPQLIEAYIRGQFVNLTSGSVYPHFDRHANHTDASLRTGEALHVGVDFNVLNTSAVVGVVRDGRPMALQELMGVRDTPTLARMLRERYQGHPMTLYPDNSGNNTSSKNAGESDFTILRQQLPQAVIDTGNSAANTLVRDRVNALNAMILTDKGERRLLVNTHACPKLTAALEQQPYDANGEPDKSGGLDHPPDALGYWIVRKWPLVRPSALGMSIGVARNG